eukprot:scaffold97553_cov40-Phaeocystis_antarctica.AAC.1
MTGKQLVNSSVLRTDNKAARDLSYNPELHNRTKHVARRHFFIRDDMVEAFELNVPLISTVNNYADFFTKTLKPGSFSSMRNKIMNIKTDKQPVVLPVLVIKQIAQQGFPAARPLCSSSRPQSDVFAHGFRRQVSTRPCLATAYGADR